MVWSVTYKLHAKFPHVINQQPWTPEPGFFAECIQQSGHSRQNLTAALKSFMEEGNKVGFVYMLRIRYISNLYTVSGLKVNRGQKPYN